MATPLQLIKDKETEQSSLIDRWKVDSDLINNEPFIMEGPNKQPVPRVYNVTLPNAAIFYAKMVALIAGVSRKMTVNDPQKKMTDDEKADIINFSGDTEIEIDTLLNNENEPEAFTSHAGYFCSRGWSAEQILFRMEGEKLITDARPLDPRWFTFEAGKQGMEWGCSRMERSRLDILREFEEFKNKFSFRGNGKTAIVRDFYDKKKHHIHINDSSIVEEDTTYPDDPPFIVKAVDFGPMLKEKDAIKGKG
ncbi:hypothetical protein LCGC14_1553320, partial [marine sediment metagenome]